MKFTIVAPEYTHQSAGVHALHLLNHKLNEHGYVSQVSTDVRNTRFLNTYHAISEDEVVVIPDVSYRDQFKQFKHLVRYCLMTPGFFGEGDSDYTGEKCVFAYIKSLYQEGEELYLNLYDKSLYNDPGLPRSGDCWYVGKGNADCDIFGVHITKKWPEEKQQLVRLFQTSNNFYCFDPFSAISKEAKLCGCKVYLRKDGLWVEENDDLIDKPDTPIEVFVNHIKKCYPGIDKNK